MNPTLVWGCPGGWSPFIPSCPRQMVPLSPRVPRPLLSAAGLSKDWGQHISPFMSGGGAHCWGPVAPPGSASFEAFPPIITRNRAVTGGGSTYSHPISHPISGSSGTLTTTLWRGSSQQGFHHYPAVTLAEDKACFVQRPPQVRLLGKGKRGCVVF